MNHDAALLTALRAGFILVLLTTFFHRLRAATREPLDRRQEGVHIFLSIRIAGAALWFSVILYVINPDLMAWSTVTLPVRWRWYGVIPFVAGLALLVWTLQNLGPNLTDTVVTRRVHTLVTSGPYRWIRHPFYVSLALFIVAMSLLSASWFILLSGVVVFILLAIRVDREEAHLAARFGERYREYRARTGRFVPWWP